MRASSGPLLFRGNMGKIESFGIIKIADFFTMTGRISVMYIIAMVKQA